MNAQRWIAVGFLGLIALCLASSSLWLPSLGLFGDEEETASATTTPEAEVAEAEEDEAEAEGTPEDGETEEEAAAAATEELTPTPEPTLDPAIAEMLTELEVEELGPGIDPHITRAGDFTTVDPLHRAEGTASL